MEYGDFHSYHAVWGGQFWETKLRERMDNPLCVERYGYKVYSQNDEDGIIQEIFKRIGEKQRTFVEFGVEDGIESNTHYLLLKGWEGLWIEGSKKAVKKIYGKFSVPIKNGNLKVINNFITTGNINEIINTAGFTGEIDLLSVDIDGNDYHVLNSITIINPRVIIAEYNGMLPPDFEWVMPYNSAHTWNKDDYFGASLLGFEKMLDKKGYQLVGTNLTGVNAFFVRKDLAGELFMKSSGGGGYKFMSELLYNPFRRNLAYLSGHNTYKFLNEPADKRKNRNKWITHFRNVIAGIGLMLFEFTKRYRK